MRRLLNRKGGWVIGIAVALALFVVFNAALTNVTGLRLDLTENRLYTLSDGTKRILRKIKDPITLDLYISQRLINEVAVYGNYAGRVRDVVHEFAAASDGKLNVVERDPEPFSETEDEAVAAGVTGVPLDASGEKVYFGLAAHEDGRTGVIGFFQPQREAFLEYDLARMLEGLIHPKKPVIGVITSLPMFGAFRPVPGRPKEWFIVDALRENFDVRNIYDVRTELTDDIDVLLIVHPVLSDDDLYAIDQYLMRRGRALVLADPYSELAAGAAANGTPLAPISSDLNRLTSKWGVTIPKGLVAGDMDQARVVNAGSRSEMKPAPYLLWPTVRNDAINRQDVVTRDINAVNLGSAGIIQVAKDASVTFEPLLETTKDSETFETKMINPRMPNVMDFVEKFKSGGKRLTLAARLTGTVDSAFPDGPPKPKDKKKAEKEKAADEAAKKPAAKKGDGKTNKSAKTAKEGEQKSEAPAKAAATGEDKKPESEPEKPKWPPHVARSKAPINVILVADSDMLKEHFWVRVQDFFGKRMAVPFANNGDFIVNALENLAGSGDLISLRSRGTAQRPFTTVEALRLEADRKFRAREQILAKRLSDVQAKFEQAQAKAKGKTKKGEAVLTPEQQKALDADMDKLRGDLISTRKELRAVQHNLRKDIESLDTTLRFIDIGLVPVLVGVFAIGLGIARTQRRKRTFET